MVHFQASSACKTRTNDDKKEENKMEINKTYEPQQIERKWYGFWEQGGYFKPNEASDKPAFTILIPPPNVTGILHMGHVLNNTA
jgi:valyl-tRNA synthetase